MIELNRPTLTCFSLFIYHKNPNVLLDSYMYQISYYPTNTELPKNSIIIPLKIHGISSTESLIEFKVPNDKYYTYETILYNSEVEKILIQGKTIDILYQQKNNEKRINN